MIEYKTGNLLNEQTDALVNTVNCVGVMGRGIALQFKKKYPENFKEYEVACKQEKVQPGTMFVHETGTLINPRYIINFPSKRHWRGKSRMEDIVSGLRDLVRVVRTYDIKSIALPPIGCGLGGLEWEKVKAQIEQTFADLCEVRVVVYEPQGSSTDHRTVRNREVPRMTPGRAALIELIHRYQMGLLDPFVTLLEVHKLMYFLQADGESLRLKFVKGPYGPYAENLRHVMNAIEGHLISGYVDGGDAPDKQLKLVPGAYQDAKTFLQSHAETQHHYDRVSDLVNGFESSMGLELLATVHWVVTKENAETMDEIISRTYSWNERKKQFTARQLKIATDVLAEQNWLDGSLKK